MHSAFSASCPVCRILPAGLHPPSLPSLSSDTGRPKVGGIESGGGAVGLGCGVKQAGMAKPDLSQIIQKGCEHRRGVGKAWGVEGPTQEQNSDLSECSPYGWFYNTPSLQHSHGTGHSGLKRKTNIEDLPLCACGSRPSMIQGFWGRGQWGLPFSDHGDKPRGTWAGGSRRGRFKL